MLFLSKDQPLGIRLSAIYALLMQILALKFKQQSNGPPSSCEHRLYIADMTISDTTYGQADRSVLTI